MALSAPTHLAYASVQNNGVPGATSLTTASVSPASDCLLILAGVNDSANNTQDSVSSITTTLANVGTWTIVQQAMGNSGAWGATRSFLAYAKVTGAPGSGTVTANWSNGQDAVVMELLYVTGHDTTTPAVNPATFSGSLHGAAAANTITAPASTSLEFVAYANTVNGAGAPSSIAAIAGYTESGQSFVTNTTFTFGLEIETSYRLTGAGTTVGVTSTLDDGWALMAIEIAQASAAPAFAPDVIITPRAAVNRAGRW